jgi:hypothetical protein
MSMQGRYRLVRALHTVMAMSRGAVVLHVSRPPGFLDCHEGRTLASVAASIARLKDFDYAGPHDRVCLYAGSLYFVPDDTLVRHDADALGVRSAKDLCGGIVPYPFVQTKAISHRLVDATAARPDGWSPAFAERIKDVVLPGYTAFGRDDARRAARRLLEHGAVRAKRPRAAGGNGQSTLRAMRDADALLETLSDGDLADHGLLFEVHLDGVTTLSIGRVTLDDATIAYYGRQRVTRDNSGRCVYGGSELTCVRGGWTVLQRLPLPSSVRTAVRQARVYDEATIEYGVVASRRNYDVGQGVDSAGRPRSGVFEASWRVGGATPAEIAALETFARDPSIELVDASTVETYGADATPPPGAAVHFHGVDPEAGPLARYSVVRRTARRAA